MSQPVATPSEGSNPPAAPATPPPANDPTAAIEAARQEEKAKLYADMDRLRKENEAAQAKLTEATRAQTELAETKAKLAAFEKAQTPQGIDTKKLIEEVAETTRKQMEGTVAELQAKVSTLDTEARRSKLELVKRQLVEDSKGEIIAGLLIGNTEEELRAAAVTARQEFQNLKTRITAGTPATQPPAAPPVPGITGHQGSGAPAPATPSNLVAKPGDMRDWRARREAALAQLKQMVG